MQPVRDALEYYQELKDLAKEESAHNPRKSISGSEPVDLIPNKVGSALRLHLIAVGRGDFNMFNFIFNVKF